MLGVASCRLGHNRLLAHVKRKPKVAGDFCNGGSTHVLLRVVGAHTPGSLQPGIEFHLLPDLRIAAVARSDTGLLLSDQTSDMLAFPDVAVMDCAGGAAGFVGDEWQQPSQSGAGRGYAAFGTYRVPRVECG